MYIIRLSLIPGSYKYFCGAGEAGEAGEVYKYFSDDVYKYLSAAGEVYINTSPALFGAGEESGNCRPIYVNISPAIVCEIYPASLAPEKRI